MAAELLGILIIAVGAYLICNLCRETARRDEQWQMVQQERLAQSMSVSGVEYDGPPAYESLYPGRGPGSMASEINFHGIPFDQFSNIGDVSRALFKAGLESSNLILGIDYTTSNEWQGENSFAGNCLHSLDETRLNPYQQVISVLCETLAPFDEDGLIPVFGFGDSSTRDKRVFPFKINTLCFGGQDVLQTYKEVTASVRLGGPTNFAPLIRQATNIVKQTKAYHILVIIADGHVTSEKATKSAIVEASHVAMSIILVGVGDGPWDMMSDFIDSLPRRKFENFHFVDFHAITSHAEKPETSFALHTLMDIPNQYKEIRNLGYLDF
ncbi:uncharacterized protein [Ptychodera flava]|uniref:uncharacterized protein n=1 Tax=Ptychodera flava TaxID=63121 RepID=UPI00396A4622